MKEYTKHFLHSIRQMFLTSVVLLLLCGLTYPILMTGLSTLLFPRQAGGSLIKVNGKPAAAAHVGQQFLQEHYLWSRPSAYHYNVYVEDAQGSQFYQDGTEFPGIGSGSANLAPSNPALVERVKADIASFLERNPGVAREDIPADLLTASGSGLDPHISPASAEIQISRIATASGLPEAQVREIIATNTTSKLMGVFGEQTVNVVKVNIDIGTAMGLIAET